jgi:hypothetical protein
MAKKKQLAGKKTKLAKLPLTQVLAGQAEELAPGGSPLAPPRAATPRLPFSGENVGEGGWGWGWKAAAGPLAQVYLHLVQELAALRSQLQPAAAAAPGEGQRLLPVQAPPPERMLLMLRRAREGLLDLHRILSRP